MASRPVSGVRRWLDRSSLRWSIVAPSLAEARLRVGVIGCGLIAQVMHLHYLRELNDRFEIVAVCDLSRTVVDRIGDAYGVSRRFTDWAALLEEPLDAVMVLTTGSHEPIVVAAAQAGRHIFVEKPIALSEAQGQAIVAAGPKAGVRRTGERRVGEEGRS